MIAVAQHPGIHPTAKAAEAAVPISGRAEAALSRPRLLYGDPIRVIGCIAVVGVHLSMRLTEDPMAAGSGLWWYYAFCDGAVRWAVPAFLMLSGALLLEPSPNESAAIFYRKRWRRMGPVLLFWPVFYLLWRSCYYHEALGLKDWVKMLVRAAPFHHLLFLFSLPGLYFFTPMLRVYIRNSNKREFHLFTIAVLATTLASGAIQEFLGVGFGLCYNAFTCFLPFLGFYLAGYALRDVLLTRRAMLVVLEGFVIAVLVYATGAALLMRRYPYPFGLYFSSQYSVTRLLGGVCAFLLFANLFRDGIKWTWLARAVSWLSTASLGIYLIHPVFIDLWHGVAVSLQWTNCGFGLLLTWAVVWASSLGATLGLRCIPVVRRIVG
jgi:surface polysaccharide O-acyltransferase-like enzyme